MSDNDTERATGAVPRLELDGIVKSYFGNTVLRNVSFTCGAGEAVGLVGHNGAGKSTVSKIVAGLERANGGEIRIDGTTHAFSSVKDSVMAGVGLVPQRLAVVPALTVRENLLLGLQVGKRSAGGRPARDKHIAAVADSLGLQGSLDQRGVELRPAAQRLVMIAQVLLRNPRLLILDEPTSSFSEVEVQRLFGIVRALQHDRQLGIIYVSHRLDEVLSLVDRVVALAEGRIIADAPVESLTKDRLADLIAGRHVDFVSAHPTSGPTTGVHKPIASDEGPRVLRCRDISVRSKLTSVSLSVRRGEIVGLTGLVGGGRTTLLNAISGAGSIPDSGEIWVSDQIYAPRSIRSSIHHRIGYLPENRARNSIFPQMTVRENVTMPTNRMFAGSALALVNGKRDRARVQEVLDRLDVRPQKALDLPMTALSGGNQQKCLLARWLLVDVDLLLLDEPTEGVDVGGREDIYRLIRELTADGMGVLLSSSDVEEVVSVCDRVLVVRGGTIAEEVAGSALTVDNVSRACIE